MQLHRRTAAVVVTLIQNLLIGEFRPGLLLASPFSASEGMATPSPAERGTREIGTAHRMISAARLTTLPMVATDSPNDGGCSFFLLDCADELLEAKAREKHRKGVDVPKLRRKSWAEKLRLSRRFPGAVIGNEARETLTRDAKPGKLL
jgi:hypothetical protein